MLGVILRRVSAIIVGVLLLFFLLLFVPLVVVVSHCRRVVRLIVGVVASVRHGLDWFDGNICVSIGFVTRAATHYANFKC